VGKRARKRVKGRGSVRAWKDDTRDRIFPAVKVAGLSLVQVQVVLLTANHVDNRHYSSSQLVSRRRSSVIHQRTQSFKLTDDADQPRPNRHPLFTQKASTTACLLWIVNVSYTDRVPPSMFFSWPLAFCVLIYTHLSLLVKAQTTNTVCDNNSETGFTFNTAGESPW
jgi:hypothetical protein